MKRILGAAASIVGSSMLLAGCTTISSGVVAGPPGINQYSFRECLLDNGFYSRQALSGIALADWERRHADPRFAARDRRHPNPTARVLLEESSAAFVQRSARILIDGLMPSLEYWQAEDRPTPDGARAGRPAPALRGAPGYADGGRNLPYVQIPEPVPYPEQPAQGLGDFLRPQGASERPDWRLNRFLDCYLAPVGGADPALAADPAAAPGWNRNGDEDGEGRLLRAHILLTLLTRFGTQLIVSHPGKRQVAQAELLLGHVAEAEKALRTASLVWSPELRARFPAGAIVLTDDHGKPTGDVEAAASFTLAGENGRVQPVLRWYGYTTRLLRVFQIGVDIERIDLQQSLDRASNIVAAFSGPLKGFDAILKDSLSGIVTVQKVRIYGDAYLRDARETLRVHRTLTGRSGTGWIYDVKATRAAWRLWDAELGKSCQVLATVAQKDVRPGEDVCAIDSAATPAAAGTGDGR